MKYFFKFVVFGFFTPFFSLAIAQTVVIDVSLKSIFDDCHIKGAINVAYDKIDSYAKGLSKDDEIILYCSNYYCIASSDAAKNLQKLGFKNVLVYKGGIAEWYQKNSEGCSCPIVGSCKQSFLKQKVNKLGLPDSEIKVIDFQSLKDKLTKAGQNENVCYNCSVFSNINDIINKIVGFIKNFFSKIF